VTSHGYRPYDHIQRSLTLSSWVNIVQVTLLSMLLVFIACRQPSIRQLNEVAELTSLTQGRVLVVEERINNALSLVGEIERQIRDLTAQVVALQHKQPGVN